MPKTPDRNINSTEINDESVYQDTGLADPTVAGTIRFRNTAFRVADGIGTFDLRRPWHALLDGPTSDTAGRVLYKVVTGVPVPSQVAYYSDAAKTKMGTLVSYTYGANAVLPTTIVSRIYNSDGTVRATCTDQIVYSGAFETQRTRTFS